ncbi:MAG: HD-GYP domain-containing protein [Desulfobulbus sp.]
MARSRPSSLQAFIYRTLTLRLAMMAVVLGFLIGCVVYLSERQNLQAQVVEGARIEIQLLIDRTSHLVAEQSKDPRVAFHQALEERLSIRRQSKDGGFVYAKFYQVGSTDSEERIDANYPLIDAVKQFAQSLQRSTSAMQGEKAEAVTLGGRLHIWVLMPIFQSVGSNPSYALAIFAPSKSARQALHKKLQRSIILALLIVGATSVLLYPVILQLVHKLTQFSQNLLDANLGTLSLLASAISKRDSDTDIHNYRVTLYAVRLAETLHLENSAIQTMIKGAFLHDVGKIGVRDDILLKPDKLDVEEFVEMQAHVGYGLDIISSSMWLADAAQVVGCHHEKYDGSGYPAGQAGEAIPLAARIFAVVDVFDALTSKRPYKQPLSFEATMDILQQGRGSHFDPIIVDVFATIAPDLYQGFAGCDDQRLRDHLRALITRYFSQGDIVLG